MTEERRQGAFLKIYPICNVSAVLVPVQIPTENAESLGVGVGSGG